MTTTTVEQRRSRRIFLLLAVIFIVPPAAAYLLYYVFPEWIPHGKVNNGQLMAPIHAVGDFPVLTAHGNVPADQLFHGSWSLVIWGGPNCDAHCAKRVFMLNNIRELLRDNRKRLRVFFVAPGDATRAALAPALEKRNRKLSVIAPGTAAASGMTQFFAGHDQPGEVVLLDPHGNWVLSYTAGQGPKPVYEDIKRLLHYSQIG